MKNIEPLHVSTGGRDDPQTLFHASHGCFRYEKKGDTLHAFFALRVAAVWFSLAIKMPYNISLHMNNAT